jgi:prepilin-type N-terminal cleavage/methylation domain-containing protein
MRNHQGFTLTELMVSVALMAVVIVWLMGFFVVQNRSYVVTDELAETQQNSRAILDLLEHEIRMAGMLVPENGAACGVDNTTAPDVLYLSDAEEIVNPQNQTTATLGACVQPGGLGTSTLTLQTCPATTTPPNQVGSAYYYYTTNPAVPTSSFRCDTGNCGAPNAVAGGIILIDKNNPSRGVACGTITQLPNATTIQLSANINLGGVAVNTADYRAIPAHVYTVVNNQLRRDNLVLANDVEDFQVAYFYDVIPNGNVDSIAQEYPGSSPALGGVVYNPANWNGARLREIRVNVVVRSRTPDLNLQGSQPQATENRTGLVPDPPGQNYHRRVVTSTVRLRNLGQRTSTRS